jgi:hypothetical protein
MAREQMSTAEETKEQRHHSIGDLLSTGGIYMNKTETEVSGEGGVDGTVGRAKAKNEVVRAETALSCAWEISE